VTFQDILYAAGDGIGVITLNRPAYRNAQSYRMLDEIDQAFDLARSDEGVRVVVVRGSGGVSPPVMTSARPREWNIARRSARSPASRPTTSSRSTTSTSC
jgi:hypothetical protein